MKVIFSTLTARLVAVPARMQAALPVPKSARDTALLRRTDPFLSATY